MLGIIASNFLKIGNGWTIVKKSKKLNFSLNAQIYNLISVPHTKRFLSYGKVKNNKPC